MSKPKQLFLTCISLVANEKGKEKVSNALSAGIKRDENGMTREQYEDLGIPVPKELLVNSSEIDEDGMIDLEDDEIEYVYDDVILELSDFSCAVDSQKSEFTKVYTKSSIVLTVVETTDDIFDQIYLLKQNWFEKTYESIKWNLKRIFNKKHDLEL